MIGDVRALRLVIYCQQSLIHQSPIRPNALLSSFRNDKLRVDCSPCSKVKAQDGTSTAHGDLHTTRYLQFLRLGNRDCGSINLISGVSLCRKSQCCSYQIQTITVYTLSHIAWQDILLRRSRVLHNSQGCTAVLYGF